MKIVNKVIYIVAVAIIFTFIYITNVNATTTLKVTAETLNLREKASTSSNIVTLLSQGDNCELIEEDGDWYKVKYKTYTGYVSKEYVKQETSSTSNQTTTTNTNPQEGKNDSANNSEEQEQITTGKVSKATDLKILPLVYSSKIDTIKKNAEVIIITDMNGWSYVQTDTMSGWIRSDVITGKKASTAANNTSTSNTTGNTDNANSTNNANNASSDKSNTTNSDKTTANDNKSNTNSSQQYTQKTMYINDSYVNLRKSASTSSDIIMVVELNTKLTVIGEDGDWYKVKTSSGNAYVLKTLLSNEKKETTSRSGITRSTTASESKTEKTTTTNKSTTTAKKTSSTNITSNSSASSTKSKSSSKGAEIVSYAKKFLGVPYVYGGASSSGFDCSGFTMYVYKHFGISMGHGATMQSKIGKAVNANKNSASSLKANLQPGDLVFFLDYETMDGIGHCGIYIGNGNFIHASSGSGYCVKINSLLPGEYYNTRYCGARRVI